MRQQEADAENDEKGKHLRVTRAEDDRNEREGRDGNEQHAPAAALPTRVEFIEAEGREDDHGWGERKPIAAGDEEGQEREDDAERENGQQRLAAAQGADEAEESERQHGPEHDERQPEHRRGGAQRLEVVTEGPTLVRLQREPELPHLQQPVAARVLQDEGDAALEPEPRHLRWRKLMADSTFRLASRVHDVPDDVRSNPLEHDVFAVGPGVRAHVEVDATECRRDASPGGEMIAHGHRDQEQAGPHTDEGGTADGEPRALSADRAPGDHGREEKQVGAQEHEPAECRPSRYRPPPGSFLQAPESVQRERRREGNERELDEQTLVEDCGQVERAEEGGEQAGGGRARTPGEPVEQHRRHGAEHELDNDGAEPASPACRVQGSEQEAVAGATVELRGPSPEPVAAGDRFGDAGVEPTVHPLGWWLVDHDGVDGAEMDQAQRQGGRGDRADRGGRPQIASGGSAGTAGFHGPLVPDEPVGSQRWRGWWGPCATAVVGAAVLFLFGFVTRLAHGFEWDELQLLHGAWRIAQGSIPYRDFFEHHPPLLHLILAPLVGRETEISWRVLVTSRGVALALLIANTCVAARLLVRAGAGGAAGWSAAALVVLSPVSGKLFELRADWFALLCLLSAMLLMVGDHRAGDRPARWFLAGALGGLAMCFTQKALPLWLGMLGWVAAGTLRPAGARSRLARVAPMLALAAGALMAPGVLALGFWQRGALGALLDSTVIVNLTWPREVEWEVCWYASSAASTGGIVLALRAMGRAARRGFGDAASNEVESLLAAVGACGMLAYLVSPVPWEQSFLFLVVPWVACLTLIAAARYARAPDQFSDDRWLLAATLLLTAASLPPGLAVRAVVIWGVAGAAIAFGLRAPARAVRLHRTAAVLLLPGLTLFVADRMHDLVAGRGRQQEDFARAVAEAAQPGEPVLALWDHVLPFRPAAAFHWFAHDGVLRRFDDDATHPLDVEYARVVDEGRARVVIADAGTLREELPGLRRALERRCRTLAVGYAGSDAYACASEPVAQPPPRVAAPPQAPNVVLVVIDTLRPDHVGCYGYPRATTPHLDALAAEGVVFERAISQAPWTAASVASLLTGLYPSVHGLDRGVRWGSRAGAGLPFVAQRVLHEAAPTLPGVLRAHGYGTAGFVSNVYLNATFGFARGFDVYVDDHDDYSDDVLRRKRRGEETNRGVVRWLDTRPAEPFFLLVHYNDPHWPYDPPRGLGREWVADYRGRLTPADTAIVVESEGRPVEGLDRDDVEYLKGLYDGEILYADANLGALLERLHAGALRRPLLTVVTADHGEEFLEHGSASHGYTLYEEQIRVPLVVHFPTRLAPRRIPDQVQLIDVMPSVLELVGLSGAATAQGRSLVGLIRGETVQGAGDAFSEAPLRGALRAVRTRAGRKLIEDVKRGRTQLFDLERDPAERTDRSGRRVGAMDGLRRRLVRWGSSNARRRAALGLGQPGASEIVVDGALRRRLEALGYVGGPDD